MVIILRKKVFKSFLITIHQKLYNLIKVLTLVKFLITLLAKAVSQMVKHDSILKRMKKKAMKVDKGRKAPRASSDRPQKCYALKQLCFSSQEGT